MTSWRLSALSSGTSAKVGPALLPVPAVDAGAKNSREQVFGYPAAQIHVPAPVPQADRDLTAMANAGNIGLPSSNPAFTWFRPSIYWVNSHERAGVSRISDNQMPVPAILPNGATSTGGGLAGSRPAKEGVVMAGGLFRGPYQVPQPRVTPSYPKLKRGHRA